MSSQWINRIFEVDPTFVSSMEKDDFTGRSDGSRTNGPMKAGLRTQAPEAQEDWDPIAVLRMGLDEHLASGSNDPGLFQRLRASLDNLAGERVQRVHPGQ